MRITSWNINSIRIRLPLVRRFVEQSAPDVICFQEIKCTPDAFPRKDLQRLGFPHILINGQKGYHGTAVVSRRPLAHREDRNLCGIAEARHQTFDVFPAPDSAPVTIHNFYVPAGGDIPDRAANPKFGHKLDFLAEVRDWLTKEQLGPRNVLLGDLNIAPLENDVWSHRQLLDVVSHTPVETDLLQSVLQSGGWVDAVRHLHPPHGKLFSWWSYRARDWDLSDRGRRLDHIWLTPDLVPSLRKAEILREARGWDKPSDHVPVTIELDI